MYTSVSLGLSDTYYAEGTYRRDRSSALPIDNNSYNYYSISGSAILSNLIESDLISFAKLRLNHAVVGNDTDHIMYLELTRSILQLMELHLHLILVRYQILI